MKTGTYTYSSLGYATLPGGDFGDLLKVGNSDQTLPRAHFVAALVRLNRATLTTSGKRVHVMRTDTAAPRQATPSSTVTLTMDCTNGASTATVSGWTSHPIVAGDYVFLSFNKLDNMGGIAGQTSGWFYVSSKATNTFTVDLQISATMALTSYPCYLRLGNQYSVSGTTCTVIARNHPYGTNHTIYLEFTARSGSAPPNGYYPVKTSGTGTFTVTLPSSAYNGATGNVQIRQYHMSIGVEGNLSTNLRKAFLHRSGLGTLGEVTGISTLDDWISTDRPFNFANGQSLSTSWVNLPWGDNSNIGFAPDSIWAWIFAWATNISGCSTWYDTNLTYSGSAIGPQSAGVGTAMPNLHHRIQAHGFQLNLRSIVSSPLGYKDLGYGAIYPDVLTSMSYLLGNEVQTIDVAKFVSVTSRSLNVHEIAMMIQGVSPWDMGFRSKGDFSLNFDSLASANLNPDVPVSVVSRGGSAITWTATGGPVMYSRTDSNKVIDEVSFV